MDTKLRLAPRRLTFDFPVPTVNSSEDALSGIAPRFSIVVPLLDERDSLAELHRQIAAAIEGAGATFEVIFVDDGSTDGSWEEVERLAAADDRVHGIRFRRNLGKAAALEAGFREARGAVVATLDADLQDDPAEIPALAAQMEAERVDMVVGWKHPRRDPAGKRVPSILFNVVAGRLGGVRLHDMNCGLKVMRREAVDQMRLYGELHRYIPILAAWRGHRVGERTVAHRPRTHGRSKFGRQRFLRGFFDLVTVLFLTRYHKRPMHLLGGLGLLLFLAGLAIAIYLTVWWFMGGTLSDRPLLFLGILLLIVSGQTVTFGLLAEMLTHLHHTGDPGPYVAGRAGRTRDSPEGRPPA